MTRCFFGGLLAWVSCGVAFGGTINVSINSSAVAGSLLKVAIDFTTSSPGAFNFCSPTCLNITNFSAPGSTMALPETSGGLVDGDLILISNPAPFTQIFKGSAFNEVIVNLNPVANLVSFTLGYTDTGPGMGLPPDEISVFLLNSSYQTLFNTGDPSGANALFAIDLTGVAGGAISVFAPTTRNGVNLSVTVPGQSTAVPEPGGFWLVSAGLTALAASRYLRRSGVNSKEGALR